MRGQLLAVDDNRVNRIKLARLIELLGHDVTLVEDGEKALELLKSRPFDLLLLDIVMPGMDGYEVLRRLRLDGALRTLPVIVISAIDNLKSVVKCIEMGAEDYLPKPFDPVLLRARIDACLEKKRLRDHEQEYLQQLQIERERSERLLLNILPQPIAERLKHGQHVIADSFPEVTVLFADIVDFTRLSAAMSPSKLVALLNHVFSTLDSIAERNGLEKIKTVGDEYMAVGGLPLPRSDHAEAAARMALAILERFADYRIDTGERLQFRIGINTGPVVAGVIGASKFCYDLWGDTVNVASRMTTQGLVNQIQVSESSYERLRHRFRFEERGPIDVKGRGEMNTFLLRGPKPIELVSPPQARSAG
ncbi:MAG: adenylate/guanylate cyclase domain-containing protein [Nannocystaceae bacterium]